MSHGRLGLIAAAISLGSALGIAAGTNEPIPPRPVTFKQSTLPLKAALAGLRRQTGNVISDRRLTKNNPTLKLPSTTQSFWPILDEIARQVDGRISPYQQDGVIDDGIIALVDGPYRPVPISYHGLFRTAVKKLVLSRDEDTGQHSCAVHLETAWEPRFQPFYVGIDPAAATFSKDGQSTALQAKLPGRGQVSVAGRPALEVEYRLPAPRRAALRIERFNGSLSVIGPSKMLTFTFDTLKPIKDGAASLRQEQEGVRVSLTRVAVQPERWTFDVLIENPPGGPQFESYQSWLDNNRIYLERGEGRQRRRFVPQTADEEQLENIRAARAAIRYHFTNRGRTQGPPGKLEDWRLVYRTPGRIVEVTVPFSFRNLELP